MDTKSQRLAARLVPQLPGLLLDQLQITQDSITIKLTTSSPAAKCPLCAAISTQVHSSYDRTLVDLPWAGYTVRLQLTVRKFFCKFANCARRIFAERLPQLVQPYARRSSRLNLIIRLIGLALGGQGGARLTARLGMAVSSSTLLRHIRRAPAPTSSEPAAKPTPLKVVGVDDFAFRKGRTYGTILIDLEQHRPIELLPDRTAETLAQWLRQHPAIEVISRDRSTEYTRGATLGAPQARQVADRFHIVKNLRESIERLLDRNRSKLVSMGIQLPRKGISINEDGEPLIPAEAARRPARRSQAESLGRQLHRVERQERYAKVKAMHDSGKSIRSIARQLGMSRGTVYHYLRIDQDPTESQWPVKPSMLDPYIPYLYRRWQDGCENAAQLVRELRERGYDGSRKMVATWVAQRRRTPAKTGPRKYRKYPDYSDDQQPQGGQGSKREQKGKEGKGQRQRTPSSIQFSYFLMREPQSLNMVEQAALTQLKQVSQDIATAYPLVQEFLGMVHERTGNEEQVDSWLSKAKSSKLIDLHNFAVGIERDKAAVVAGLTEEWSNGQTEGQVNRLKLKKRQMYGRAKFDLLQRRVLDAA